MSPSINRDQTHCCCLLNSEKVKRETIFGAKSNSYRYKIDSLMKLESILYH